MKVNYNSTIRSCFIGYIVQAIVNNFVPLLFITFQSQYSICLLYTSLAEAFECEVNELPLSMILSWYEQKAVCILLTLLHLGIKNIRLGPTLPAFISPNVLGYLVENYNIAKITTPEEDLKNILG